MLRIFETHPQLQAAYALPVGTPGAYRSFVDYGPAAFVCDQCGKAEILPHSVKYTGFGASGYALTRTNRMLCFACADSAQRLELSDRSRPFSAYLSGDGNQVTTWTGGRLGAVHSLSSARTGWHGSKVYRGHARDVHGAWWQFWSPGPGMYCTMRPIKKPDYAKHWGA